MCLKLRCTVIRRWVTGHFILLEKVGRRLLILIIFLTVVTILFILPTKLQKQTQLKIYSPQSIAYTKKLHSMEQKLSNWIYILQWKTRFIGKGEGSEVFANEGCEYTNCYTTTNSNYFGPDYTKFDIIVFYAPRVLYLSNNELPQIRSPHQKYVFASIETSDYYPLCSNKYDGYFNWTWSFRLDSDVRWGYVVIRDDSDKIIGPKLHMHWMDPVNMYPVSQKLRNRLKTKYKMAAWIVSNCESRNGRESFVYHLDKELQKINKSYRVDIYGKCGTEECPYNRLCEDMIEEDYFFYLAFENSDNEDYVTEKLVRALEFNVVPVVYGGANYTRFMPHGIYLNAKELGVQKLALTMVEIINNFEGYVEMFRWKNHYYYHTTYTRPDGNDFCRFCTFVNNKSKLEEITVKKDFRKWWDLPKSCAK